MQYQSIKLCMIASFLVFTGYSQIKPVKFDGHLQIINLDLSESGGIYLTNQSPTDRIDSLSPAKHGKNPPKGMFRGNFELNHNIPIQFKIKNINPLRYNYFLNDELIANFLESTSFRTENNSYINAVSAIKEIPAINIFNFEAFDERKPNNIEQVADLKKEIKKMKDDNDNVREQWNHENFMITRMPQYEEYFKKASVPNISWENLKKKYPDITNRLELNDKLFYNIDRTDERIKAKVSELQALIAIGSDKNIKTLKIHESRNSSAKDTEVKEVVGNIKNIINDLESDMELCKSVIENLGKASLTKEKGTRGGTINVHNAGYTRNVYTYHDRSNVDSLTKYLYLLGFPVNLIKSNGSGKVDGIYAEDQLRIIEFIADKKNKSVELAILAVSLEIGKLLEKKWVDYNRDKNNYLNKSWIGESDIKDLDSIRSGIKEVFNFAKQWIADFALISYTLRVESKIFKGVHESITLNCLKFLDLLKDMDHFNKSTIIDYTSPIFHNQKNVDIIRFKLERQDKLSGAKQTYVYDYWIRGGLKIDFSAGIFATSLTDRKYNILPYYGHDSTLPTPSSDSFFISQSNAGKIDFSFGGMVNMSWRNGQDWINYGVGVGIAYSANQRLQILTAANFQLGKAERIILHFGIAMGAVKEIDTRNIIFAGGPPRSPHLRDDYYLVRGDSREFKIPEIERFRVQPFIGISYNLSKRNPLQAVSSQSGLKNYNAQFPD